MAAIVVSFYFKGDIIPVYIPISVIISQNTEVCFKNIVQCVLENIDESLVPEIIFQEGA